MNGIVGFVTTAGVFVFLSVMEELLYIGGIKPTIGKYLCAFLIVVWINQFFGGGEDADSGGDSEGNDWRSGDADRIGEGIPLRTEDTRDG